MRYENMQRLAELLAQKNAKVALTKMIERLVEVDASAADSLSRIASEVTAEPSGSTRVGCCFFKEGPAQALTEAQCEVAGGVRWVESPCPEGAGGTKAP
jgi:hypothetical protein